MSAAPRTVTPPGHSVGVWAPTIERAPVITWHELPVYLDWPKAAGRLLVLSAHPDDECFGCGRLIHLWSRHRRVDAITASAGEACIDHVASRPEGLADLRLREWRRALDVLGVSTRRCLDVPDTHLAAHEQTLVDQIRGWLDQPAPKDSETVVLAAPWRHDPHPDHQACGRAAAAIAEERRLPLLEYPVWTTYWAPPESLAATGSSLLVLESDRGADRAHREAVAAFVSQLEPLAADLEAVVPAAMLRHHDRQLLLVTDSP